MKTIKLSFKIGIGIFILFLSLQACDSNKKVKESEISQLETIIQDPLRISNVDVSLVKLDYEIKAKDKTYAQAWLIQLAIPNMPKNYGSKIDFYIGDYKIPEYGGTENGIYFRVFEKAALERMNAAEIRYKYESSKDIISSNQYLKLPELDKLEMRNEKDQLNKKNR